MIIRAKIDATKILKEHMFLGKNGAKYVDLTLLENRDGVDQFGNNGMVVQDLGKEARAAGKRGPILGNYKIISDGNPVRHKSNSEPERDLNEVAGGAPKQEDDVPF